MSRRALNHDELPLARDVFRRSIPYECVIVTDEIGFQGRPYTIVYPSVSPPFDSGPPLGGGKDRYHLNVGPAFSGLETSEYYRGVLIHELTHVWQACHSIWPASYIFDSMWHQVTSAGTAYKFTAGAPWATYNVEQQASIVERWFLNGQNESDSLFPYIRDVIRGSKRLR